MRFFWHCTQFGTLHGPSAKMFLLFTRPTSLIWSFFPLKLRYPALYSIYSSGAGFIAACNHNCTLFLFMINCQLGMLCCHSPYATTELFDELKVSAPLFLWALIFQLSWYSLPTEGLLGWENSWHFAKLPLVFQRNDVSGTSAEIPYWRRVTTQSWLLLPICRIAREICFGQLETLPRSG